MLAAQYIVRLPADYDMEIIRHRVATRGSWFDGFPGLHMKAFLISEREAGVPENRYAPFYVWRQPTGLHEFLFGEGFDALRTSFGRPRIDTGLVVASAASFEDSGPQGGSATLERRLLPPDTDLPALRETEQSRVEAATSGGALAAVSAVDISDWQIVHFTLWPSGSETRDLGTPHDRYELLHLSIGAGQRDSGEVRHALPRT